jgi:UTP-glucose-1-phosphate uridylyltransferase
MKPTLVVLAAGMGSRFGGLKQLEPVGPSGELVLDYSVHDAVRAGFGDVVFVIRQELEPAFRERVLSRYEGRVPCALAFQELDALPDGMTVPAGREKPWGTAHAILCARRQVRGPFLAINADDFYGADAFRRMITFFEADAPAAGPARFAMAGYPLGDTLSAHGSVARGVCEVDAHGRLVGIVERTGIERVGGRIVAVSAEGEPLQFREDQPVSMNFWGLTPAIFPALERLLREFLQALGTEPKSEFYIPSAIFALIASGHCIVDVLPTTGRWFGVTHRADQPAVADAVRALVASGEYPTPLWGMG